MNGPKGWLDRLRPAQRARREAEREVSIRRARRNVERYVADQQSAAARLWDLAGRALAVEDRAQFARIGRQYLETLDNIRRWERYAIALDTLTLQREQAQGTSLFLLALQGLGSSVLAGPDAAAAARIERELAGGAARASDLTTALDRLLAQTERTVDAMTLEFRGMEAEPLLAELERAIAARGSESGRDKELDARIEAGFRLIAEEAATRKSALDETIGEAQR